MFGDGKKRNRIDQLAEEIRSGYRELSDDYSRPESLGRQFELRYHDAVEYRVDLLRFLEAEQEAVKALFDRAKEKAAEKAAEKDEKSKPKSPSAPGPVRKSEAGKILRGEERISYADKLIKEFAERIEKYPEIIIHPDAAFEMKKLFGALLCIEKDYWASIDKIIRNQVGSKRFRDSVDIEPEINRMCTPGVDGLPSALSGYCSLLERQQRDYDEIEREEKRCLIKAAGLLKRLQMEIIRALDMGSSMEDEERVLLIDAKYYIESMLDDFRLKDLAKLS